MKALFVCNQNKHRSPTAAALFSDLFETKSAGLYSGNLLTTNLLEWADIVFVMEDVARKEIGVRFPKQYLAKKILCLDIPDVYSYNQPELRAILKTKLANIMHLTKLQVVA
jgi:predicted protein tyrosine phosphatase